MSYLMKARLGSSEQQILGVYRLDRLYLRELSYCQGLVALDIFDTMS
jgi:hypothetical protein